MSLVQAKKNYLIFSILKSTAWIVPVLFVFIDQQMQLTMKEVLFWAGLFNILPFVLEIPFGYLGDIVGDKKIVLSAIAIQIMSCLALLFIDGLYGYQVYLVSIYAASALYSGAEKSIIHEYFNDEEDFRSFMLDVSGKTYKYTMLFLFLGAGLYGLYPKAPFVLQIFSFILAYISFGQLEDLRNISKVNNTSKPVPLRKAFAYVFRDNFFLGLCLLFSIFALGISVNHKLIQSDFLNTMAEFKNLPQYILLGLFYILGNMASSAGIKFFKKIGGDKQSFQLQLMLMTAMGSFAFGLFAIQSLWSVILGFVILNSFKAIFRPIINSKIIHLIPFKEYKTTILSIFSLISALVISLGQVLLSGNFANSEINLYLSLIMPAGFIGYIILKKITNFSMSLSSSLLTKKHTQLVRYNGEYYIKQIYPQNFSDEEKEYFSSMKEISLCPIKSVESNSLLQEFIADRALSESNRDIEKKIDELVPKLYEVHQKDSCYYSPTVDVINDLDFSLELKKKMGNLKYQKFIHGDLHPGNVFAPNKLIDWDLAGIGWLWYDYLMLLFGPMIDVSFEYRVKKIKDILHELSADEIKELVISFLRYKKIQLRGLGEVSKEMYDVSLGFEKLLAEAKKYVY